MPIFVVLQTVSGTYEILLRIELYLQFKCQYSITEQLFKIRH